MNYDRLELIKRVKAEIEARKARAAAHTEELERQRWQMREEYIARTSDAWGYFAKKIAQCVRQGKPVTVEHVPPELRDPNWKERIALWMEPKFNEAPANTRVLEGMLALLESCTDATVSLNTLSRAGFSLRELVK